VRSKRIIFPSNMYNTYRNFPWSSFHEINATVRLMDRSIILSAQNRSPRLVMPTKQVVTLRCRSYNLIAFASSPQTELLFGCTAANLSKVKSAPISILCNFLETSIIVRANLPFITERLAGKKKASRELGRDIVLRALFWSRDYCT
jgi:hypothetical protein